MRRTIAVALLALLTLNLAEAQKRRQPREGKTGSGLGPHAVSDNSCLSCHPPHKTGTFPLWEEKPAPPSKTGVSGGEEKGEEKKVLPQPSDSANQPMTVNERCSSCHDGNLAKTP